MLGVEDGIQRPADYDRRRARFMIIEAVVGVSRPEQWSAVE